MKKLNTKLKLLSMALVGLGGLGLAGGAFAACPTAPTAWASVADASGSVEIASGGLDGSACSLDTSLTGSLGFASAYVSDDSPADEPSYRAQFLVDASALGSVTISQVVRIFAASTENPAMAVPDVVSLTLYGNVSGSQSILGISTACANGVSGICGFSIPLTSTGPQRVEIEWVKGSPGTLNVWLNNNDESNPDVTMSINNSAWGGVDDAYLGLYAASAGFRAAHLNQVVSFDTFDSRRQTFIGY